MYKNETIRTDVWYNYIGDDIMHFKKVKGILSAKNGMNIYRGCTHGCIYCDSRSNCYNFEHKFEDIEVKENALELLEESLMKKRKKVIISTGSMTDPYIHLEEKLLMTRRSLEIIEKYGCGINILTKSNRILRDIEILDRINKKSKCIVNMTLTTFNENLCKIIEPNVSTSKERYNVLMKMREYNITTIVWLDPILPFINDTEENLKGILDYCIKAEVYGIVCFGFGLTLRDGNREYFYEKLDQFFPGLKEVYQKKYGDSYQVTSIHHEKLWRMFKDICEKNNIIWDINELFKYMSTIDKKNENIQLKFIYD